MQAHKRSDFYFSLAGDIALAWGTSLLLTAAALLLAMNTNAFGGELCIATMTP